MSMFDNIKDDVQGLVDEHAKSALDGLDGQDDGIP
jgi:hypothetical protein